MKTTLKILIPFLLVAVTPAHSGEKWDLKVDSAALKAQNRAIEKLNQLAKKFAGTRREEMLLLKLVEAQQEASKIEYRIVHGTSQLTGKPLNIKPYERRLRQLINTVGSVLEKFPHSGRMEAMLLTRARAYEEIDAKTLATQDYERVAKLPPSSWTVKANLSLGELAIKSGEYKRAITYLERVEAMPNDPRYPFALYQIGWSYFNLEDVPKSLDYLSRQLEYYKEKLKKSPNSTLSSADKALKEQSLRDMVAFYFSSYDNQSNDFSLDDAKSRFKEWESGDYLGRMYLHFGKLLLNRDRLDALETWTKEIVEQEPNRPETLELVVTYYEYIAEKRKGDRLTKAEGLFKRLNDRGAGLSVSPYYSTALDRILGVAGSLQNALTSTKEEKKASEMRKMLSTVYRTYVNLADPRDPKGIQARFNLAEIDFAEKNYKEAATGFRWFVQNRFENSLIDPATASMKAIISDYQVLLSENRLPKEISPAEPKGDEDPDFDALPESSGNWLRAVKAHVKEFGRNPKDFETFEYEAYRVLYASGQTTAAMEAMSEMIENRPSSNVALPAANLILDSYLIKNEESALKFVEKFKNIPSLKNKAFRSRLTEIPAELGFRSIEKAYRDEDFQKAAALGEEFLKGYSKNHWAPHVLWIGARAALEKKDIPKARQWLSHLIKTYPNFENKGVALITRAGILEEQYNFEAAHDDYIEYLKLPAKGDQSNRTAIAKRLFFTSWLSDKTPPLSCSDYKGDREIHEACDHTQALQVLSKPPSASSYKLAENLARSGYAANRPLWAAIALRSNLQKIPIRRRLEFTKLVAKSWGGMDPLIKFTLIPVLNHTVPEAFSVSREALPRYAPLKSDTKALVNRINRIQGVEETAGEVLDVPWVQVKVSVLGSIGEIYGDFCTELAKLPTPKDLSPAELQEYRSSISEVLKPFGEKRDTIRKQVKELAEKSPVYPNMVPGITGGPERNIASTETLENALLKQLFTAPPPASGTEAVPQDMALRNAVNLWSEALTQGHWARTGFFYGEVKDRFKAPKETLAVMQAISLFRAGAQAEAISEMENVRSDLAPQPKQLAEKLLMSWYMRSTMPQKAKGLSAQASGGKK